MVNHFYRGEVTLNSGDGPLNAIISSGEFHKLSLKAQQSFQGKQRQFVMQ